MDIQTSVEEWMKKTKTVLRRESMFRGMPCLIEDHDTDYKREEIYPVPLIEILSSNRFRGTLTYIEYFTMQSFISNLHLDKVVLHLSIGNNGFKLVIQFNHDNLNMHIVCHKYPQVPYPSVIKMIQHEVEQFIREYSPNRLFMTTKTYTLNSAI